MKIIYDLGANAGQNLDYYLQKSDKVVAVEANPSLCDKIKRRWKNEIDAGLLVVVNKVIALNSNVSVPFWKHKSLDVCSRSIPPDNEILSVADYEKVMLPAITINELFASYGDPYYVKIDLEDYDAICLRSVLELGFRPPYISVEFQKIDAFTILHAIGGYDAFKLVEGDTVDRAYANAIIEARKGKKTHSFSIHSAGPFGNDVAGPWFTAAAFNRMLGVRGTGWRDIHATSVDLADPKNIFEIKPVLQIKQVKLE